MNANNTGSSLSDQGDISARNYDQSNSQFGGIAGGTAGFDTSNSTASTGFDRSDDWSSRANVGSNSNDFQPAGTATGDDYGSLPRETAGNARSWRGPGQDNQQQQGSDDWNKQSSTPAGLGQNDDEFDSGNTQSRQGSKPSLGDKMKGMFLPHASSSDLNHLRR